MSTIRSTNEPEGLSATRAARVTIGGDLVVGPIGYGAMQLTGRRSPTSPR